MLKVMTWNVENLFRPGSEDGPESPAVYAAKLAGLSATINTAAPDLIGLQEIGDPGALNDLVALLDGAWHQRVSAYPGNRGIRVACLSRHPIVHSDDISPFLPHLLPVQSDDEGGREHAMGRGAVAITVAVPGKPPLRFVTAHLKSKLLTFPGRRFEPKDEDERARFGAYALFRRAAEAATLRAWATDALAFRGDSRPVVVTGDLNDTPDAATTQVLLGPPGSEIGTRGFRVPDRGDPERLWNLAPLMPEGRNYSRVHRGRGELIDHILVSAALVHGVASAGSIIDEPLASVTETPHERQNAPSSDHAPVVAEFEF